MLVGFDGPGPWPAMRALAVHLSGSGGVVGSALAGTPFSKQSLRRQEPVRQGVTNRRSRMVPAVGISCRYRIVNLWRSDVGIGDVVSLMPRAEHSWLSVPAGSPMDPGAGARVRER